MMQTNTPSTCTTPINTIMNNANNNHGQNREDGVSEATQQLNNSSSLGASNNGLQQQLVGLQGLQLLQNSLPLQHFSTPNSNPLQQPPVQYAAHLGSTLFQQINESTAAQQQPRTNNTGIENNILSSILFGANQVAQLPITSQNNSNTNIPLLTTASLSLSAAAATAAQQLKQCLPIDGNGTENSNRKKTISQGATIVPCRARSIAKDHNEKTAYFIIPRGIRHGDGLLCSHLKCKNKGIRFVYCRVCDQPVAKVNYTTRHRHPEVFGQSESTTTAKESVTDNGSSFSESDKKKKSSTKAPKKKKRNRDSMEYSSATATGHHSSEEGPPYRNQDNNKRKREQPTSAVSSSQRDTSSEMNFEGRSPDSSSNSLSARNKGQNRPNQSTEQLKATTNIQREWLALLEQRPSKRDRKSMRFWMERVLFTSEYVAPAKAPTEQDSHTSGSSRGSRGSQSSSGTQSSGIISGLLADAMGSLESIHQALSKMNEAPSPLHGIPSTRPAKSSTTSTSNQNSSSSNWEEEFREAMRIQVTDKKPASSSTTMMSGRQKSRTTSNNENTTVSNEDPPVSCNNQNSSSNGE